MKRTVIIVALLITGLCLLAYPIVSNYLIQKNGSNAIQAFTEQLAHEDSTEISEQRALAEEYNAGLTGEHITDPFVPGSGIVLPDNYNEIMDFSNHMIGYIEIPKIVVYLPIYHGVSEEVFAKGVGHLRETAFPIGGKGNHSVLTGHTGLSKARLFTDLVELVDGDVFYIHVFNDTLAYKINQIKVIEPTNTDDLQPVPGEDYVTLITCTPYAVNSHRLILRGTRIAYSQQEYEEEINTNTFVLNQIDKRAILYGIIIAVLLLMLLVVILIIITRRRDQKRLKSPMIPLAHKRGNHEKPKR